MSAHRGFYPLADRQRSDAALTPPTFRQHAKLAGVPEIDTIHHKASDRVSRASKRLERITVAAAYELPMSSNGGSD